ASGADVLNSTEIYDWAHGRRRFRWGERSAGEVYSRTLRTLRAMCEPVGRAPTIGRPWLWRLRNSHEGTRQGGIISVTHEALSHRRRGREADRGRAQAWSIRPPGRHHDPDRL